MSKENPCQFTDAAGEAWVIRLDSLALQEGFRMLDVSMEDLQDFQKMNVGSMIGMVWYGVQDLARARKITREQFWKERVPPALWGVALDALAGALAEAFPDADVEKGDPAPLAEGATPAPGPTKT